MNSLKIGVGVFIGFMILVAVLGGLMGSKSEVVFKDTTVDMPSIRNIGKLQVMSANVNIVDDITIGASALPDFKRIYNRKGTAVYSVDLSRIGFFIDQTQPNKTVFIKLPSLEVELFLDERTTKQIAEYQKKGWTGNAADGFLSYLTTSKNGYEAMEKSLQQYEGLMLEARKSAIKRVRQLAETTYLDNDVSFEVFFGEDGGQRQ